MALDGAFLHQLRREIWDRAQEARIDKIYQPNRDELVFVLRTRSERMNLLISTRANSARVHFTTVVPENPAQPPMFCMLLRKRFTGGRLLRIEQPGLERLLIFVFDTVNELGDHVEMRLITEVMGRYSNVVLVDPEGKIVDALKRVDADMSSERWILPGLTYQLPPPQEKLCLLEAEPEEIAARLAGLPRDYELSKGLLQVMQGVSPVVCREMAFLTGRGRDLTAKTLTPEQRERLVFHLARLKDTVEKENGTPFMVVSLQKKPMDFSFFRIGQYASSAIVRECATYSRLLDDFYTERDTLERMRVREQDLLRVLTTVSDRLSRKIANQTAELVRSTDREKYRIMGDLLNANQYQIEKGSTRVTLMNFYSETGEEMEIPLDPALTPNQNAQKYYKEYRKAKTAEEKLTEQIAIAQEDLLYLDSVLEELSRARTEKELTAIRLELMEQGYIRRSKGKRIQPQNSEPLRFTTSDGHTVLVGRNNRQNDQLTLKTAKNYDMWFHVKNMPGSHVILVTQGETPSDSAMEEAAVLAARYSRGRDSSQVPVDYTHAKNVTKPQGAKPGRVIYVHYKTIFVDPKQGEEKE